MATSGAELRALVMNANAEAETGKSMLFQARTKLEEVMAEYRRIADKLGPSAQSLISAIQEIEQTIVLVNQAIDHATTYAAGVA